VQSANTVVFIPSSFDFIRVQNHFRSLTGTTHTVLSEYGNKLYEGLLTDVSFNRQVFFQPRYLPSKASLLRRQQVIFARQRTVPLLQEVRSHAETLITLGLLTTGPRPFSCCRYKIRGIRNVIFYGPPDHPQFLSEFLSFPSLDNGVDTSDVTCRVLYSKYDFFRMERIVGTREAVAMVSAN
jgi:U3 small nucleolar RNA-associated protein 25